jgi:uncharacterized Ntn-hydrolase superfamily protein
MPKPSTFSIVAVDPATGSCGVAVASKFLAVGAIVPFAKAGVGAIATQSFVNLSYGKSGLKMLASGIGAQETLNRLTHDDDNRDSRQAGIVDAAGNAATFTGAACFDWAGGRTGRAAGMGFAAQGNMLTGADVVGAMADAFASTNGDLARRLLAALAAGDTAGGDKRGRQSAALLVVRPNSGYGGYTDRWLDLRVDDHAAPVTELKRLFALHDLYFGVTPAVEKLRIDDPLARELLRVAVAHGHYRGTTPAMLDAAAWSAIDAFIGTENLEERVNLTARTIDPPALAHIRACWPASANT